MKSQTRASAPTRSWLGPDDLTRLKLGVTTLGLALSDEQLAKLFEYGQLIQKWNAVYNLTAIRSPAELISHHLLDSLAVVPCIDKALQGVLRPSLLDVGAGAGLPGLVLAVARPDWQITLIDTVQKKAAFMQQAIATLGLTNARAVHGRVEHYSVESPFNLICSRAFSTMDQFIALTAHLLHPEGVYAALKGRLEVDNTVPSGWRIVSVYPIEVPFLDEERHLFVIQR
ncbi:MAG TPA: 16S rRNA (guanine(527)-N(7))-methyltransferase RsmG [Limnobacter sp.]|nr:16S rRNA (guanine(527)-N(7))-methyltransferase RsmG [Limnobacter sp.]